jgi:hypothetical protein
MVIEVQLSRAQIDFPHGCICTAAESRFRARAENSDQIDGA